ncbi:MAG: 23S rRNA (adenine(2503)-C(2))-methyltransferase RlmN [Nannocystaceae bacterium]|nr:23S rRNA (adenine(2503)-C(2))-methyltransferase RlmN [bacterium]
MSELVAIRRPRTGLPRTDETGPNLRGMSPDELAAFVQQTLGGPRYRADQVYEWLHKHRVTSFEAMTNLGKAQRAALGEASTVRGLDVDTVLRSVDGTRKLRLRTSDGHQIESVLIPNDGRGFTLCISSMVGCSLTCQFCATQTLGFQRNLAAWEIVDQVYRAQTLLADDAAADDAQWAPRITNLVLMGMGEPLHNFVQVRRAIDLLTDDRGAGIAGRRITVSTAGLVPAIERFGREGLAEEVGLAVSLNATTDAVRDQVMPINTKWNIETLLATVRALPANRRRRITYEYVLLDGVNDTDADAARLIGLLEGSGAHVNAIPFNPHAGAPYGRPSAQRVSRFVERLRRGGVAVHVRTPRGDDIGAACGQLALDAGSSAQPS